VGKTRKVDKSKFEKKAKFAGSGKKRTYVIKPYNPRDGYTQLDDPEMEGEDTMFPIHFDINTEETSNE
jgi:hypothetical protein